jgi:hypothetical protein
VNIFELKIWDDESRCCTFYTVQGDGESENETDKFFARYENESEYERAVQELLNFVLYTIGEDHGAVDALFNGYENEVVGLPVKGKIQLGELSYHFLQFVLRLYALKITEKIVVLFGGGVKDGRTNQTSSLNMNWIEACRFARKITDALREGVVIVDEHNRTLTNHLGGDEIVL